MGLGQPGAQQPLGQTLPKLTGHSFLRTREAVRTLWAGMAEGLHGECGAKVSEEGGRWTCPVERLHWGVGAEAFWRRGGSVVQVRRWTL